MLRGKDGAKRNQGELKREKRRGTEQQGGPQARIRREDQLEEVFGRGTSNRYFVVKFENKVHKRKLCPFKIEADLIQQLKGKPKARERHGAVSIMVEVANEQQSENISKVKEILGSKCESRGHEAFNS